MLDMDWRRIETAPENVLVETKIDDLAYGERNVAPLERRGRMWFSGEMYVYYRPTHWRPLRETGNA